MGRARASPRSGLRHRGAGPDDVGVEGFDGTIRRAQVVLQATLASIAVGVLSLIRPVPGDHWGAARLWASVPLSLFLGVLAWAVAGMRLAPRAFPDGFAARVRPTRWVRANSGDVVLAEMVEISPFREYSGWMDHRRSGDRLLGGCGGVAL